MTVIMLKSKILAGGLAAAALACALLAGCEKSAAPARKPNPPMVQVAVMAPSDETLWIETLGKTEGAAQSEVRAQVSGILKKISYAEGSEVKAGDVLFVLDDGPYRAAAAAATASVRQSAATLEQARREAERYKKLYAAQAASRKQMDDAVSAALSASGAYAAAAAKEADARINLERTRVTAPEAGVAGNAQVNLGSLVSASTTLLTTITQPERVRVNFQCSERDIARGSVTAGSPVRVTDAGGRVIPARLDYIAKRFDPNSATLALRALLEGEHGVLPGQYVHVQVGVKTLKGVFRVPQRAVIQMPDGTYQVWLEQEGRSVTRPVKVGNWKETDWIVLEGLEAGDRVIVNQLQRLRNNGRVVIDDGRPRKKKN
ncbi:MAG: efflux RND transporter periplasmic adaptor subunit [Duodenibacillus sp.]|nr:efflux RND transporter periplasmic adaptor subunit [Duodenibacillus sp.]